MSTNVQKFEFPFEDKRVGIVNVPVEIREIGEDTVVVFTRVKKEPFKLERMFPSVAVALAKTCLVERNLSRVRWVMFIPTWGEDGRGASVLVQPSTDDRGMIDFFGLGDGMLAENAVPMPRDGTRCITTAVVG